MVIPSKSCQNVPLLQSVNCYLWFSICTGSSEPFKISKTYPLSSQGMDICFHLFFSLYDFKFSNNHILFHNILCQFCSWSPDVVRTVTALLSHFALQSISCCLRHRFIPALVGSWEQVIGECNRLPADSVNCPWRQRRGGPIISPVVSSDHSTFCREPIYYIMQHLRCLKSRGLHFPAIKCIVQKSLFSRQIGF